MIKKNTKEESKMPIFEKEIRLEAVEELRKEKNEEIEALHEELKNEKKNVIKIYYEKELSEHQFGKEIREKCQQNYNEAREEYSKKEREIHTRIERLVKDVDALDIEIDKIKKEF